MSAAVDYCDVCGVVHEDGVPFCDCADLARGASGSSSSPSEPVEPSALVVPPEPCPSPSPCPWEAEVGESHIDELLRLHREGRVRPVPVMLGEMPAGATPAMHAIADDIACRLGLFLGDGVTRALMYARSEALKTGAVATSRGAGYVLKQFVRGGRHPLRRRDAEARGVRHAPIRSARLVAHRSRGARGRARNGMA